MFMSNIMMKSTPWCMTKHDGGIVHVLYKRDNRLKLYISKDSDLLWQ